MGSRRRGREMALQVLCSLDRQPDLSAEQALHLYFRNLLSGEPAESRPSESSADEALANKRFAEALVCGVQDSIESLDALITRCSRNWRLERMSWVDRNLLRLACFELRDRSDTPSRVVLNEAIEIARRYSTSESSGFVNGVLDRV